MATVSMRELRERGNEVVSRVERGETLTVTRNGVGVAELRPLPRPGLSATELLLRWKQPLTVDPDALRADVDATIDSGL